MDIIQDSIRFLIKSKRLRADTLCIFWQKLKQLKSIFQCEKLENAVTEKWYIFNQKHKKCMCIFHMAVSEKMPIYIYGSVTLSSPTFTWVNNICLLEMKLFFGLKSYTNICLSLKFNIHDPDACWVLIYGYVCWFLDKEYLDAILSWICSKIDFLINLIPMDFQEF